MLSMFFVAVVGIVIVIYVYIKYFLVDVMPLINRCFDYFCDNPAILSTSDFPWTSVFRTNWEVIKDEYVNYSKRHVIPTHGDVSDYTSSCDVNKSWKSLFLRVYGVDTDIAKCFPKTMQMISDLPCTLAMFSVFEPGTKLSRHRGIYKGVLRYHLPLIVPDEWDRCFININGRVHNWRLQEDLMFDDMFLHHAENGTNQQRVVLFLDIKRDFKSFFLNLINSILLRCVRSNDVLNQTLESINKFHKVKDDTSS